MPLMLKMAGAFLVVLVIIFIIGMLWFHIVEGLLGSLRKKFFSPKEPAVWYTLEEAKRHQEPQNTKKN